MDPNTTLDRIRELSRLILDDAPDTPQLADELAGMCDALDTWLAKGGFPPRRWVKAFNG